ncbi:MAG TPA: SpoVR family protein [Chthonomonadaceae bacterium]|nr:SpoVR family protein [Chthonomonadaceae bacterium]
MNHQEREELEKWIDIITEKALEYGLDFYPTHFEVVPDYVIYELGSYSLPARFSHWTFGRDYHRQKTSYEYGMSKIYEIVFNTDPCQAFLMDSNSMLSHKFVVAHVLGHNDFFKNNVYFEHTDRRMIEKVRLHGNRIRKYEEEFGPLVVEEFLDAVLSIELNFDTGLTTSFRRKSPEQHEAERLHPQKPTTEYDDLWDITGSTAPTAPKPRKFPPEPDKDLLGFLREHAPELEKWQRDILNMIREEMIYFIPQMRTKIANEGWACATKNSLLLTSQGISRFDHLVEKGEKISVGSGAVGAKHPITDFHKEANVPTLRITTRRGLSIEGALKHRVQLADGSWAYLKDVKQGDRIALACGTEIWPEQQVPIAYAPKARDASLTDVAEEAGVSLWTVLRHRAGKRTLRAAEIDRALDASAYQVGRTGKTISTRQRLCLPDTVNEALAYLLGYFVGDGNITKSGICLTCGDEAHARYLDCMVEATLGIPATVRDDRTATGPRWRVEVHSRELLCLLECLGVNLSARARDKQIPEAILRSPRAVMSAFLRGYFDADGYAGPGGVILSTASKELARTVQILLLNYGILSSQRLQAKEIINLEIRGASVAKFREAIGFKLARKQEALNAYVENRRWFKREETTDEIVAIEAGQADVYDITVDVAHAYVANGFVNHNSFWHERIMTELPLTPEEHLEFRKLHSSVLSPGSRMSINPYYVGYNILRDIERRWNGEADEDFPEEDWRGEKLKRPQGEGMKKLFEVRRDENDVTFLRKYLTQGLVNKLDMYTYKLEEVNGEQMWVVQDTDWRRVRDTLLDTMTNFGIPIILVEDADYNRHGELLLRHAYDGKALDMDYTARTLKNIHFLWKRPVHIATVIENVETLLTHDGVEFTQKPM